MAVLALAVIPALIMEDRAADSTVRAAAVAANWVIWLAFVGEFTVKLALAPIRPVFVRSAWPDIAIILLSPPFLVPDSLQGTRALRVLRLLRLVRLLAVAGLAMRFSRQAFGRRRFHYVLLVALSTIALGALGLWLAEDRSFGDAVWWAIVTATTVGYGDISPSTVEGRIIAVLLMLTGIGVIGIFTATVASFFFDQDQSGGLAAVEERLTRIEQKLDALTGHDERRV